MALKPSSTTSLARCAYAGGGEILAGVAVAVEADAVAELAAEEPVDRHAERLAGQVPEGDLDPGHRGHGRAGHRPVEELCAAHLLEERSTLSGFSPMMELLEGVDHLRTALAAVDALAVADQPLVGVDADVGRVAVPLDLRGADVGDLHAALPPPTVLLHRGGALPRSVRRGAPRLRVYSAAFSALGRIVVVNRAAGGDFAADPLF